MENQLIKYKLKQIMLEMTNLCRNLQLEYIDLYLIHLPISSTPGKGRWPVDEEDLMPMDFKSVWAAMEARGLALPSPLESATSLARSFITCSPLPLFLLQ